MQRANALADEAAKASSLNSIYDVVDEVRYAKGASEFSIKGGKRILTVGSNAFRRNQAGQLLEVSDEIVHAQQWQRAVNRAGGNLKQAYNDFFINTPVGSPGYALDELVAERLSRMRVRKYLGGLSPQQAAVATRYINFWRRFR